MTSAPGKVLIVGAGASHECGFPLGSELLGRLHASIGLLCGCLQVRDAELKQADLSRKQFAQACKHTSHGSIDELLIRRPDLRAAGALSLAAALMEAQIKVVKNRSTRNGWQFALYEKLLRGQALAQARQPAQGLPAAVVTFNYDLNIEITIARSLIADFGRDASEVWDSVEDLPIRHVHGCLDLEDFIVSMLDDDAYSPTVTMDLLRRAGGSLLLTKDDAIRHDADVMVECRQWVWDASDVLFLGFGFDPINLDKIGIGPNHPQWMAKPRRITCTSKGLSRVEAVRSRCPDIAFAPSDISNEALVRWFMDGQDVLRDELGRFPLVAPCWIISSQPTMSA